MSFNLALFIQNLTRGNSASPNTGLSIQYLSLIWSVGRKITEVLSTEKLERCRIGIRWKSEVLLIGNGAGVFRTSRGMVR
jgi:hypothetical protein